jgi:hypothetical protein
MVRLEDSAPVSEKQGRPLSDTAASTSIEPLRTTWTVATAALTAATAIAQLVIDGSGRVLLAAVGLVSLSVLTVRLIRSRYVPQIVELEAQLAETATRLAIQDRAIHRYRSAVERIVDRQFPLFEERVEITVTVGARSGEDSIVERHWTTPKPYLVYRLIRPITAVNGPLVPTFDELELTCEIEGDDVGAAILPVSEAASGVLVLILFQPGLQREMEWSIRYRTPRLWDPLRADGFDRLGWAPSTRDGRETTIAITDLTVHFAFPPEARNASVRECHDSGQQPTWDRSTAERRLTWRDLTPSTPRYDWELWLSRTTS